MAKKTKVPWEQLKGEPPAAYARFLIYRNLGPARTLDLAYAAYLARSAEDEQAPKGTGKPVPGSWKHECSHWCWADRAATWDIARLEELGQKAIVAFAAFLEALSRRALGVLADPSIQPRNWETLLHTAEVISGLIDPRAVEAVLDQNREQVEGPEGILPHPSTRRS